MPSQYSTTGGVTVAAPAVTPAAERREEAEMVEPKRGGGGISGGEFAGIGIQFALVILVFTAAGIWLDRRLGTSPWLLILFVFLGAGGQFYSLYRKAMAAQRRDAEQRARAKSDRGER